MIRRFETRLERLLPSTADGKALRAEALERVHALKEIVRRDSALPTVQSKLPWRGAGELAYVADAEEKADRLTEALLSPAGRSRLGLLGELYATLATYEGNKSARYALGGFFMTFPSLMLVAATPLTVVFWAIVTGEQHNPAHVDQVMSVAMRSVSAVAGLGLAGVFASQRGRKWVYQAGSGFGEAESVLRIENAFWTRLRRNLATTPELSAYLPEVDDGDFPFFFLSRLHYLAPAPVADCELWLDARAAI